MKKLITVLTLIALIFVCGCGQKKLPQELLDAGNQALTVSQNYLSGSIDEKTLQSKLIDIEDYIDNLDLSDDEKDAISARLGTPKSIAVIISSNIMVIRLSTASYSSANTYEEVQKLKKYLDNFQ